MIDRRPRRRRAAVLLMFALAAPLAAAFGCETTDQPKPGGWDDRARDDQKRSAKDRNNDPLTSRSRPKEKAWWE
jgi:hypothetical protein